MPKFIITWEVGNYGETSEVYEAETLAEAKSAAIEAAEIEAISLISTCKAEPYTKKLAEELGLADEDEESEKETD